MAKRRLRKVAACFMAHPDDCEFLAAGTMALLARRGWELHIVTCTPGDCGSAELGPEEISRVRRAEAARAAAVIGATYHCLELRDLNITFDRDAISRTVRLARDIAPSLMFTHALQDYMPDHEVAAQLARTASVSWFVPNAAAGPIPPDGGAVPYLYYADPAGGIDHFGNAAVATTYVDTTSVHGAKERMVKAHASQRAWLRRHFGMDEFLDVMRRHSRSRGAEIGVRWAEGFRQHRGAGYPKDCVLTRELGDVVLTRNAPTAPDAEREAIR